MPSCETVLNRVFLVGNLTRDPDGIRRTPQGTAVTYLRLALNTRVRTGDGVALEEKCFVDVSAWGRQAEIVVEKLGRGSQILVEGRLWSEELKKGGGKQSRLTVVADRIVLLAKPMRHEPDGGNTGRQQGRGGVEKEGMAETAGDVG